MREWNRAQHNLKKKERTETSTGPPITTPMAASVIGHGPYPH
jgi:hypothetical protein